MVSVSIENCKELVLKQKHPAFIIMGIYNIYIYISQ